ncbi:MAG: transglutaminase-like putative cysteine protease [Bacteroidia bacterium]|jgi:transglutaminase-like putative cysteine protease
MRNSTPLLIGLLFLAIVSCQSNKEKVKAHFETDQDTTKVTVEDVEKGIRANIEARIKEGGGYFDFQNDTLDLSLKLVRVHTEYLSVLSRNNYFACVDLATADGDVYDMDFFLKGIPGDMQLTRIELHKLNGKPYYTWKQEKDKTWSTVAVKNATNALMGVVEGQDQFTFTYEVQLPEISKAAKMWVPVAQSDTFQTIEIESLDVPGKHQIINEDQDGNTILYLELLPEHSSKKVVINYIVDRKEKAAYSEAGSNLPKYLEATVFLPVGGRFKTIADEVIWKKQANTPLTKARALYDYIIDNMRYAKGGIYGTGDANYACDSKTGNCTEFHSFFISLSRSAGIPARFAVGAAIPSERNNGKVDGYHCWAEFYAENKWWPIDISEANKYTPLATYYFGHHPANRIEFSRGRDITPNPLPESGAINFMAYPTLEIGGKKSSVKTTLSFSRISVDG